jgi:K+-transporting ATPase ATPase A chain
MFSFILACAFCIGVAVFLADLMGYVLFRIIGNQQNFWDPLFNPIEVKIKKWCGVKKGAEHSALQYGVSILVFNTCVLIYLMLLMMYQDILPWNIHHVSGLSLTESFLRSLSVLTTINFHLYDAASLSPFVKTAGLSVVMFTGPLTALCVAVVLMRSLYVKTSGDQLTSKASRFETQSIPWSSEQVFGNFFSDFIRFGVRFFLPLTLCFSLLLSYLGTPENTPRNVHVSSHDSKEVTLESGLIASFESIKILGNNGASYFNENSGHGLENPSPYSLKAQAIAMMLLPFSVVFAFGYMSNNRRHIFSLVSVLIIVLSATLIAGYYVIKNDPACIPSTGRPPFGDQDLSAFNHLLYAIISHSTSTGAFTFPLDQASWTFNALVFIKMALNGFDMGSCGSGFYGLMPYILLTLFLMGLMSGKTPDYCGRFLSATHMTHMVLLFMIPIILSLVLIAVSVWKSGAEGGSLSSLLFAGVSLVTQNGTLCGVHPYMKETSYPLMASIVIFFSRFGMMAVVLSLARTFFKQGMEIAPALPEHGMSHLVFSMVFIFVVCVISGCVYAPYFITGFLMKGAL